MQTLNAHLSSRLFLASFFGKSLQKSGELKYDKLGIFQSKWEGQDGGIYSMQPMQNWHNLHECTSANSCPSVLKSWKCEYIQFQFNPSILFSLPCSLSISCRLHCDFCSIFQSQWSRKVSCCEVLWFLWIFADILRTAYMKKDFLYIYG